MATPAQALARRVYYYLARIAPEYLSPRQTASKSTQTFAETFAQTFAQTASTSTQTSEDDLPPSARTRSKVAGPKKKLDLDSVQTSRVTKRWGKAPKKVTRCKGLSNRGNSCYMNSVLQCLFNMPEFVGYLDGLHNEADCPEGLCVVCALKAVLGAYTDTEVSNIPQDINVGLEEAIKLTLADDHPLAEYISADRQGDPYVYLQYLLDQLEACEQPAEDPKSTDMFNIEAKTEWTCTECGNVTTTEGEQAASAGGVGVSLNIQQPKIGSSMLAYMRHNEFETELKIRCESKRCIKKHGKDHVGDERTRTKYITKAPEILVVQLDRGAMVGGKATKIKERVDFEEYVNLGEFTEAGFPIMYQLQGVVAHRGKTLNGGHYIAGVRDPSGKEFCSIDDNVKIGRECDGTVAELEGPTSWGSGYDPFVLFYTKL